MLNVHSLSFLRDGFVLVGEGKDHDEPFLYGLNKTDLNIVAYHYLYVKRLKVIHFL